MKWTIHYRLEYAIRQYDKQSVFFSNSWTEQKGPWKEVSDLGECFRAYTGESQEEAMPLDQDRSKEKGSGAYPSEM